MPGRRPRGAVTPSRGSLLRRQPPHRYETVINPAVVKRRSTGNAIDAEKLAELKQTRDARTTKLESSVYKRPVTHPGGTPRDFPRRGRSFKRESGEISSGRPNAAEILVLAFGYISITARRFCWVLPALVLLALPAAAQNPTPVGVWLHPDKRIEIEIAPCGDRLCAKIVWFKRPNGDNGLPLADVKNRNPALRLRPLLGLNVLQGLRAAGENNWEDGEVYNPDDGVNYRARMSIDNAGDLRIRAFILLPLLGHTLIWTPVR